VDKIIEYPGVDSKGNILIQALTPVRGLVKTAGALHPEIAAYISTIRPQPNKYLYVLVNALSAGEWWGSNINGDYFPEDQLAHEGRDYGYNTFYNAGVFLHHQNKVPERSFGKIVKVVYNKQMHRVELIQRLDREKAREEGAQDIIDQLDSGKHPPTSMGCRVPFDVCSWCHNRSKTTSDYCDCARNYRNHVANEEQAARFGIPVGLKQYLINIHPKFFDDSYVLIGADVTSYALMKVASMFGQGLPSAALAQMYGLPKMADLNKQAVKGKLAEILKRVPAMSAKTMSALQDREPGLPGDLLRGADLPSLLSTMGALGMVMSPSEFQHGMLSHLGAPEAARKLGAQGVQFRPTNAHAPMGFGYGSQHFDPMIKSMLMPLFGSRSIFEPVLKRRVTIVIQGGSPAGKPTHIKDSTLDKVSAAYNTYLSTLPEKLASLSHLALVDPEVAGELDPTGYGLHKYAGTGQMALMAGLLPLFYLYSRSLKNRVEQGDPTIGGLRKFIANNPILSAMLAGGAALGIKVR
jgi:hypothetical protein